MRKKMSGELFSLSADTQPGPRKVRAPRHDKLLKKIVYVYIYIYVIIFLYIYFVDGAERISPTA